MRIRNINFAKSQEHINPYLTHWTGAKKTPDEAFEILKVILFTLKLKFGKNKISFEESRRKVKQEMICFTDTPIKLSHEHCKNYGYIGISFNKQKMIEYGANPVLYLGDNRRGNNEALQDTNYNEPEITAALGWFRSIVQYYNSNKHFPPYKEREWRIVRILPVRYLTKDVIASHKEYKFSGDIERVETDNDFRNDKFYLPFEIDVIENIIVSKEFSERAIKLLIDLKIDKELLILNSKNNWCGKFFTNIISLWEK